MSDELFALDGRVALVTGGSRGIGRTIAAAFVRRGVKVYITARKAAPCDATAAELSAIGPGSCISLPIDISDFAGIQRLASELMSREARLDILVNNAGANWLAAFDEVTEPGWDKVVDLNLKTPFFLCQALAAPLRAAASKARPAKVINVASIDGVSLNTLELYPYAAAKSGLIHLTRQMAIRLIADDIVVSAIAPGAFPSDMYVEARDEPDLVAAKIPARRIGRDSDIAGAAVYLASKAGDYVVGATLVVDGGVTHAR
jgi:2-deoxy-D-gluconate 3-dehydrogenase